VERWDVGLGGQAEGEDSVGHDAENRTAKWAESVMRKTHSGKYAVDYLKLHSPKPEAEADFEVEILREWKRPEQG
jgi:hypothetical protein